MLSTRVVQAMEDQRAEVIKQFVVGDDLDLAVLIIVSEGFALTLTQMDGAPNNDKPVGIDTSTWDNKGILQVLPPPTQPITNLLNSMGDLRRLSAILCKQPMA